MSTRYRSVLYDAKLGRVFVRLLHIQNNPAQVQTAVPGAMRKELQWHDAELSSVLFEG